MYLNDTLDPARASGKLIGPPTLHQKEVREITQHGLTEAKSLVESAPKAVKEGINKAEAEEIKTKIEAVGGTVERK